MHAFCWRPRSAVLLFTPTTECKIQIIKSPGATAFRGALARRCLQVWAEIAGRASEMNYALENNSAVWYSCCFRFNFCACGCPRAEGKGREILCMLEWNSWPDLGVMNCCSWALSPWYIHILGSHFVSPDDSLIVRQADCIHCVAAELSWLILCGVINAIEIIVNSAAEIVRWNCLGKWRNIGLYSLYITFLIK